MITIVRMCSGPPGTVFHGIESIACWEEAVVRLVRRGDRWKRPLCVACAIAFEELCRREGLPEPDFELIPDAAAVIA